ncbi:DMP19 family protein [Roseovarius sp. 2305UL8-3]|uniref:DMP19 family protein n=1 Tax=Roseovarius conchicola TaxID=3121636 RepID=UPI0035290A4B
MELYDCPWNRFVARATDQSQPNAAEEPLYALFWYQAEVNNGGHLQYFLNRDDPSEWKGAADVARSIDQASVANNLETAIQRWRSRVREAPETVDEYIDEALQEEFDAFDKRYYELDPALHVAFERTIDELEEASNASGD